MIGYGLPAIYRMIGYDFPAVRINPFPTPIHVTWHTVAIRIHMQLLYVSIRSCFTHL